MDTGLKYEELMALVQDLAKAPNYMAFGGLQKRAQALISNNAPLGTSSNSWPNHWPTQEFAEVAIEASWAKARGAWVSLRLLVVGKESSMLRDALAFADVAIYRGERGWIDASKDAHNAINQIEQSVRDDGLWYKKDQEIQDKGTFTIRDILTPFAYGISALRAATPRS